MLLRDKDTVAFKKWLLPKLETISDADSEVLADYVIALITANEEEDVVRRGCLESLVDFLGENTEAFVDEVVGGLKGGGYKIKVEGGAKTTRAVKPAKPADASRAAPIPSIVGNATNVDYESHHSRAPNTPPANAPTGPAASRSTNAQDLHQNPRNAPLPSQANAPGFKVKGQETKKRKQVHQDANETPDGQDAHYNRTNTGNRPTKQAVRRGLRGAVGVNSLHGGAASFQPQMNTPRFTPMPQMANPFNIANLPPPPPGPMPFDVNDPMAFFTMMATLGMNIPGMPAMPNSMPSSNGINGQAKVGKCHSYHEKGYCRLGAMCSFQHGEVESVPKYDPNQPSLSMQKPSKNRNFAKGGRTRADFSLPGPTTDRTNATLVVEQIPQEHFSEDEIRGYFSEFGTIADVELHNYKRLAVIKYQDHSGANRAYNSPKAVFENRFVKVYWKRPDTIISPPSLLYDDTNMENAYDDDEDFTSPEEFAQRQAEAQKAFEDRRKRFEETEARAAEIDRLLKEKDAEMREIRKQLAELAGEEVNEQNTSAIKDFSHDLATLQAEAANLFGRDESPAFAGPGGPIRGGYSGRVFSSYATRGRGFAPLRGRGAPRGRVAVSVRRLDNRPRRIAVSGVEKGSDRDEALRQYLLGLPECTSIGPHPEKSDTLILTFRERYQAESFLDSSRHIPSIGPLDLSWIPNNAFGGLTASTTTTTSITARTLLAEDTEIGVDSDDDSSATVGEGVGAGVKVEEIDSEADMDVADDVDQWL